MALKVAIVGRPNVGKSRLFNRLADDPHAIVSNIPGVTRDRRSSSATLADITFELIDTAGVEDSPVSELEASMLSQTQKAAIDADILLLMIDGKAGITPLDEHVVVWLRKQSTPTHLIVNKADTKQAVHTAMESHRLGLGDPMLVSAEHGTGMDALYELLQPLVLKEAEERAKHPEDDETVQVALVGRPNAGKSTLFNYLVKEERSITGPQAGITRDAIHVPVQHGDTTIKLVDTAGMRKAAKGQDELEMLSIKDAKRAIQYAHVVVLMVDAELGLDKQDLQIASHVLEEGRALLIALNKWDKIREPNAVLEKIDHRLTKSLAQLQQVPVITISALKGKGSDQIFDAALALYAQWNQRISTGKLNRWLENVLEEHPPPLGAQHKRIKLRYMTQTAARPPRFALFTTSNVAKLPESYLRYLTNQLSRDFQLESVPVRLVLRKQNNPYEK